MQTHPAQAGLSPLRTHAETSFTVHSVRPLTESTYVLRFDRNGIEFRPGQHLHLGISDSMDLREYSVFSGADDPHFEVLVKEIEEGLVSKQLRRLSPGDPVNVKGPFGFFTLPEKPLDEKYLFVATGTGIAPFSCFIRSHPDLNYRLLHGVRHTQERYASEQFDRTRTTACLTQPVDSEGYDFPWYHGRVTQWLSEHTVDTESLCYLCGSCDMIYEVFDILKEKGVPTRHIFAEVYF